MIEVFLHALRWYAVIQVIGWTTFRLCAPELRVLVDHGHSLSKMLGVLLTGMLAWIFAFGWGGYGTLRAWLAVALLVAVAGWFGRRRPRAEISTQARRSWLLNEVVFALFFFGACLVKSGFPAVEHTEQPMDLALLSAISAQPGLPTPDPWFAGEPVRYYTFGLFLVAHLGRLAGTSAEFSYNLGLAAWFALLAITVFGVGCALSARSRRRKSNAPDLAVGLLATVAVTLVGTLVYAREWLIAAWNGTTVDRGHWWWFRSARAAFDRDLDGAPIEMITETPIFGFLLGDLHPHLLALPLVVITAGLSVAIVLRADEARLSFGMVILLATSSAGLTMTNAWSGPLALGLALTALALHAASREGTALRFLRNAIPFGLLYVGLVVRAFAQGAPDRRGMLPNLFGPTDAASWLVVWGSLLPGLLLAGAACLIGMLGGAPARPNRSSSLRNQTLAVAGTAAGLLILGLVLWATLWFSTTGNGGATHWLQARRSRLPDGTSLAALQFDRWIAHGGWPLLWILMLATAAARLWRHRADRAHRTLSAVALLLAAAVGSILVPEFVLLGDVFGTRMNTVFKFHHQAWPLAGLVAAWGLVWAARRANLSTTRSVRWSLWSACALGAVLICAAIATLPEAVRARWEQNGDRRGTLSTWVGVPEPEQQAAVWLLRETEADAVLATAPGRSYEFASSRLCTLTGRACVVGWEGHLWQWHGDQALGEIEARKRDLEVIYRGPPRDPDAAERSSALQPPAHAPRLQTLLDRDIDYVVLGPRERAVYALDPTHEIGLIDLLGTAFRSGEGDQSVSILGPVAAGNQRLGSAQSDG